jgi:hypothetical protein
MDRQDVRMVELGCDPNLSKETLRAERRRDFGGQNLQRDRTVVFPVLSQVDRAHAAATELALDQVTAPEGRGKSGERKL